MEPTNSSNRTEQVEEWIEHDPDAETRAELRGLLEKNDVDALNDRFSQRLTFGTAGIRGTQGAGPNQMNRLTVRRLAVGIAKYLGQGKSVVIGYDARKNSKIYAADIAGIFSHYGINSQVFTKTIPTPVISFAVRQQSADLGIMVTASHNPATDNGCKVFLPDGAQLRTPIDLQIDSLIEDSQLPPRETAKGTGVIAEATKEVWEEYCSAVANTVTPLAGSMTIAYTPLHGVSWETIERVFELAEITNLVQVPTQMQPDPNFPSTPFPNPEERGSLDRLLQIARSEKADIAIANDPDGDRLAIGIPDRSGQWRNLTGDEVGALLCNRMLQLTTGQNRKVVSSVVSSSLVGKIAEAAGAEHAQTLTGFKWIIPEAYRDLKMNPVFAYEEALGYAVSDLVRDKDGISAALRFVEMAEDLKRKNMTVLDQLNKLYLEFGLHVSRSKPLRIATKGPLPKVDFASELLKGTLPGALAELQVSELSDYDQVAINAGLALPKSNMIRLILETDIRVLIRPSGTEPVVKIYLEKVVDINQEDEIEHERTRTNKIFDRVLDGLQQYLDAVLI